MIIKPKTCIEYVGPKALFDGNYIPPTLLYRVKEEKNLNSLLYDSVLDNFCCTILYQGLQGIGKKAIINKVIKNLTTQNKFHSDIHKLIVDCKEKDMHEIIFSLITDLSLIPNFNLNPVSFLNSTISELWNIFKLIMSKIEKPLILVFNNIEDLKPSNFRKFIKYSQETKTTLISTINRINRTNTFDLLNEFDYKKRLDLYCYSELLDILKQRIRLSFMHEIDIELIEYITDLIFEHYVPVPGKGIDILKELYPLLKNPNNTCHLDYINLTQTQFDTINFPDEFSLLTYISEEELLMIIFLDNLANFFLSNSNYYISNEKLEELYIISCESIESEVSKIQYTNIIRNLMSIGLINTSKKALRVNGTSEFNENSNNSLFYLIINPKQLKAIVDAIFSKQ
ncbi:MAG: hypothetical protein EU542_05800 [Promethearchaeota archaeon]|nr:MAG: hypothetical protein EU542_05800 [Candidatus Lokiarchaeota archaeon]